jgi:hypothetical protein
VNLKTGVGARPTTKRTPRRSCSKKKAGLSRPARVLHCEACGLETDRDLNAAHNLAALAELACVMVLAQILTGQSVDWSKLPIRPNGWERDHRTRSSRGCARAGGPRADGGDARPGPMPSGTPLRQSFDREAVVATGSVGSPGGASPSPKKAVA